MKLEIRSARPDDAADIHRLILALADYEKLSDAVEATEADTARALFGPTPRVFCDLALWAGAPAGLALWFYDYSSFAGRHGIFVHDLFVAPERRGHGIGKALLAGLARRCIDEDLAFMKWQVLDWNAPAIAFYRSLGAEARPDWVENRLGRDDLATLAKTAE